MKSVIPIIIVYLETFIMQEYTPQLQHIKLKNELVNQILSVKIDITRMLNTFMLAAVHTLYFHEQLTN